jgi:hypothetical protein
MQYSVTSFRLKRLVLLSRWSKWCHLKSKVPITYHSEPLLLQRKGRCQSHPSLKSTINNSMWVAHTRDKRTGNILALQGAWKSYMHAGCFPWNPSWDVMPTPWKFEFLNAWETTAEASSISQQLSISYSELMTSWAHTVARPANQTEMEIDPPSVGTSRQLAMHRCVKLCCSGSSLSNGIKLCTHEWSTSPEL